MGLPSNLRFSNAGKSLSLYSSSIESIRLKLRLRFLKFGNCEMFSRDFKLLLLRQRVYTVVESFCEFKQSMKHKPFSTSESFVLSSERHLGLARIISESFFGCQSRVLRIELWFNWVGVNGDVSIDSLKTENVLLSGDYVSLTAYLNFNYN